jgi:hypothetical protein
MQRITTFALRRQSFKVGSTLVANKNALVINTWALDFLFPSLVDGKKHKIA